MQNFLFSNKIKKFLLAFPKKNIWKISMHFGTFARQVEKLARYLAH